MLYTKLSMVQLKKSLKSIAYIVQWPKYLGHTGKNVYFYTSVSHTALAKHSNKETLTNHALREKKEPTTPAESNVTGIHKQSIGKVGLTAGCVVFRRLPKQFSSPFSIFRGTWRNRREFGIYLVYAPPRCSASRLTPSYLRQ